MTNWVNEAIRDKADNLELFRISYEKSSIAYIFETLSNIPRNQMSKFRAEEKEEVLDKLPFDIEYPLYNLVFASSMGTAVPFYVSVYKKHFDIFEKLENYSNMMTKEVLDSLGGLSRGQRVKVKKGISAYKSIDMDERMKLCEIIER